MIFDTNQKRPKILQILILFFCLTVLCTNIIIKDNHSTHSESSIIFKHTKKSRKYAGIRASSNGNVTFESSKNKGIVISESSINFKGLTSFDRLNITGVPVFQYNFNSIPTYEKNWLLFYFEPFEAYNNNWRYNNFSLVQCGNYPDHILLHDCKSDKADVETSVSILPKHSEV